DPVRRAAIEQSFARSGRSYAGETFVRMAEQLDGYAYNWTAMRGEVCRATRVEARQSQLAADLRMRCLDRRLAAFAELTALLAERPDAEVVDASLEAVAALPSLRACADVARLAAAAPLPEDPAARLAVEKATRAVDRAEALLGT